MSELLFWLLIFIIFYTYMGYSLVIMILPIFLHWPIKKGAKYPRVTFLITAYNEEKDIQRKLEDTLALDYPKDKLEIIVASDGSTDRTDNIVKEFHDQGVILKRVEGWVGKTATQNEAVRSATGEIIIFSDATITYDKNAIRKLARNYHDPSVGAGGRYEYSNPTGAPVGIGTVLFWKYENFIKSMQTK